MQKAKTFNTRQRALRSLVALCGESGICKPDGDAVVARAFGRTREVLDLGALWQGVMAGCSANTPEELQRGVPDAVRQILRTVDITKLRDWDAHVGLGFKSDMDAAGYEKIDPVLLLLVASHGVEGKDADMLARLLQAVSITENPASRRYAIVGLAVRAGAIEEERMRIAVDENDVKRLDALCKEAEKSYDGSLDGFVEVYRHYHAYSAIKRPKVGVNDCLDLEPLLYFSATDQGQIYVTGEDLWATVVDLAFKGRSLDVKPIAVRAE